MPMWVLRDQAIDWKRKLIEVGNIDFNPILVPSCKCFLGSTSWYFLYSHKVFIWQSLNTVRRYVHGLKWLNIVLRGKIDQLLTFLWNAQKHFSFLWLLFVTVYNHHMWHFNHIGAKIAKISNRMIKRGLDTSSFNSIFLKINPYDPTSKSVRRIFSK